MTDENEAWVNCYGKEYFDKRFCDGCPLDQLLHIPGHTRCPAMGNPYWRTCPGWAVATLLKDEDTTS